MGSTAMTIGMTELEHCTLAAISEHQPCSAYDVRQVFARSPTPDWSGSTGAIYPVIKRLAGRELIEIEAEAKGPRGRRNLSITPQGAAALRAWIIGIEPWMAKASPDPIRTRVSFLDQLKSHDERIEFLKAARKLTEGMIQELVPEVESYRSLSTPEYLAGRGAIAQLEARRVWLCELADFYSNDGR